MFLSLENINTWNKVIQTLLTAGVKNWCELHSNKIDTSVHHLEIVPFSLLVTDVPDALVLAQVMVPPQGLGTGLSVVSGFGNAPWLHFRVAGMGPWGTPLGCALPFHRAQPSQGLDIRVPWAAHFVKSSQELTPWCDDAQNLLSQGWGWRLGLVDQIGWPGVTT